MRGRLSNGLSRGLRGRPHLRRAHEIEVALRRSLPREEGRLLATAADQVRSQVRAGGQGADLGDPAVRPIRRSEQGRRSADLRQARAVGRDDGAAARHRLQCREPEPLREGGEGQAQGALHQVGEIVVGDEAEVADILSALQVLGGVDGRLAARHHEVEPELAQGGRQSEQQVEVLVAGAGPEGQHEGAFQAVGVPVQGRRRPDGLPRIPGVHVLVPVREDDDVGGSHGEMVRDLPGGEGRDGGDPRGTAAQKRLERSVEGPERRAVALRRIEHVRVVDADDLIGLQRGGGVAEVEQSTGPGARQDELLPGMASRGTDGAERRAREPGILRARHGQQGGALAPRGQGRAQRPGDVHRVALNPGHRLGEEPTVDSKRSDCRHAVTLLRSEPRFSDRIREQECSTFRESGTVGAARSGAGITHNPVRVQKTRM